MRCFRCGVHLYINALEKFCIFSSFTSHYTGSYITRYPFCIIAHSLPHHFALCLQFPLLPLISTSMETSKPHVALLPLPGMGHMIPYLGLGKLFATHHNFKVTIFLVSIDHSSQTESKTIISEMSNELCNIVQLPPVDITSLVDSNATIGVRLPVTMREIVPAFRSSIATMKPCPTVLVSRQ